MIDNVVHYWQWGRFFEHLNRPLKTLPRANYFQNEWFAPYLFQKSDLFIIPLWIPTTLALSLFTPPVVTPVRLPYIPAYLFDPLGSYFLFKEPMHVFDQWLRFELMDESGKIVYQNQKDLLHSCDELLDQLSEGKWLQILFDQGFNRVERDVTLSDRSFFNTIVHPLNPLQQQFLQFSDEENYYPDMESDLYDEDNIDLNNLPSVKKDIFHENKTITNVNFLPHQSSVHCFRRGDPEQSRFLEKQRRFLLKEKKKVLLLRWDLRQQCESIWQAQNSDLIGPETENQANVSNASNKNTLNFIPKKWIRLNQITHCDVLIIMDAERFFSHTLFPYLKYAESILWIGDQSAMTPFPLLTAYQESLLLAYTHLSDDGVQEEIHYRGMSIATGNALQNAMTHSLYGAENQSLETLNRYSSQVNFVDCPGKAMKNLSNPQQANDLATWLRQQIISGVMDSHDVRVVTLFASQVQSLQQALRVEGLDFPVMTLASMPAKQVNHIVFSSVYTTQDKRPFILDMGEAIWHQLQAAAMDVLWIVGDTAIFDAKCHSPTGKIAKKWLKTMCIYSTQA